MAGSLRLRLLGALGLTLVLVLGLVGLALDRAYRQSTLSAVQERLESTFYLALAAVEESPAGELVVEDRLADPRLQRPGSGLYVVIQTVQGPWYSPSAISVSLPPAATADGSVQAGTIDLELSRSAEGWHRLRRGLAFELQDGSLAPLSITVLESASIAMQSVQAFRQGLWRWLGGTVAVLLVAQLLFISWALRPLRRMAREVARVERGDLPWLQQAYPQELTPLTANLNRLLRSEAANRVRYRNALDSLAHGLKTPLAVLRAELSEHPELAAGAFDEALDDMQQRIGLQLEQAGKSARRTMLSPVEVAPLVARLQRGLDKVHAGRNIECRVAIEPGTVFHGEERDLLEILGNLLDNAYKYAAGQVWLEARTLEGQAGQGWPGLWLEVGNDGASLDPERFEELLARGVRGDERAHGHGIGLAIVDQLVRSYDGELSARPLDQPGSLVRVRIPPR